MQRKIEIIAPTVDAAMEEAVKRLHIASDKIFINDNYELRVFFNLLLN